MRDPRKWLDIKFTVSVRLRSCQEKIYKNDDVELLEKTPIGWYNLTLFSEGQKDDNNVTLEDV